MGRILKVTTVDPKKGRVQVGTYNENSKVLTLPKKKEHFMRVVGGYGIQEDVFRRAVKRNCRVAIVVGKMIYYSDIETWVVSGKTADYGHGKQRFLSLRYMYGTDTDV